MEEEEKINHLGRKMPYLNLKRFENLQVPYKRGEENEYCCALRVKDVRFRGRKGYYD